MTNKNKGVRVKLYQPAHLTYVKLQQQQQYPEYQLTLEYLSYLKDESWPAFSLWHRNRCLGAVGVIKQWKNRAFVWCLLDEQAKHHLLGITRHIQFQLEQLTIKRLETTCEVNFPQGERWLKLLGFEKECLAKSYMTDSRDIYIYRRLQ